MTSAVIDQAAAVKGRTDAIDNGRIIIARTQRDVDSTLRRWMKQGVQPIAHDLESAAADTAPNGTGLHAHLGYVRLAQFAVYDGGDGIPEALVVDVWKQNPAKLYALLADPAWPTIIHFAQMEQRFHGWTQGLAITNLIDTCHVDKLVYPFELDEHGDVLFDEQKGKEIKAKHNLAICNLRNLGYVMDKTQQNSAWDRVKLTPEQEEYAGLDVLSLLDLWRYYEPMLTESMWAEMELKAAERIAKSCAPAPSDDLDPDVLTQATPHDEAERVIRMIRAARSKTELAAVQAALPHMRIHFHNADRVKRSLARAKGRLTRGKKPDMPVKVQIAGWRRPF
jgi:hypothetical protein